MLDFFPRSLSIDFWAHTLQRPFFLGSYIFLLYSSVSTGDSLPLAQVPLAGQDEDKCVTESSPRRVDAVLFPLPLLLFLNPKCTR